MRVGEVLADARGSEVRDCRRGGREHVAPLAQPLPHALPIPLTALPAPPQALSEG